MMLALFVSELQSQRSSCACAYRAMLNEMLTWVYLIIPCAIMRTTEGFIPARE